MNLRERRLRISPWLALIIGGILVVWALVEKGTAVSLDDLYPGLAVLTAGVLLYEFLKYVDRPRDFEEPPDADEDLQKR